MTALTTPVFGLTADDIRIKLNPLNQPYGFQYGASLDVTEAECLNVNMVAESIVLSRIPERYRELCRRVDGEILTEYAVPNTTTYQLGLYPATQLIIYRNYPADMAWSARTYANRTVSPEAWSGSTTLTATDIYGTTWTFTPATGALTCSQALNQGDTLIVEYNHTSGAALRQLRHIALGLAAAEWGKRLPSTDANYARYASWETQCYSDLKRMREKGDGKLSIDELDSLNLVHETRSSRGAQPESNGGGYL